MTLTYCKRATDPGFVTVNHDGETITHVRKMWDSSTSGSNSTSVAASSVNRRSWITDNAVPAPNLLSWGNGEYTWNYRISTANTNLSLVQVIFRRVSNNGQTVKASKYGPAINIQLSSGVKSGTVTWDDGSQNPADAAANDILEVIFRVSNSVASSQTYSVGSGVTPDDDVTAPIDTPYVPPTSSTTYTITSTFVRRV